MGRDGRRTGLHRIGCSYTIRECSGFEVEVRRATGLSAVLMLLAIRAGEMANAYATGHRALGPTIPEMVKWGANGIKSHGTFDYNLTLFRGHCECVHHSKRAEVAV